MRYYIWDVRWSRRFVSAVLVHMSEKVWRITWLYNASLIRRLLKSIRTDLSEFLYIEKWNTISQNYKAWVKMNSFLKINVGNLLHNSIIFFFSESSVFFVHAHPKQELLQESRRWNFRWQSAIVHNVPLCYEDKTLQSADPWTHAP